MIEDIFTKLEREKAAANKGKDGVSNNSTSSSSSSSSSSSQPAAGGGTENNYLIFLGDGQGGKSSLIQAFLKPTASKDVKPTIALEYNFARRTTATGAKSVAHLYEIGGDFLEGSLAEVILNKNYLGQTTLCIILDLSKPHNTLTSLLRTLTFLKKVVAKKTEEVQASNVHALTALRSMISTAYEGHPDIAKLRPLEVSLLVVGTKYSSFKTLQGGEKKLLLQCMRFVCHYFGASLLCIDLNDPTAREVYRSLMGNIAFRQPVKAVQEVNEKYVCITRGMDTFDNILLSDLASSSAALEGNPKVKYRMVASAEEAGLYLSNKGVTKGCWGLISDLCTAAFGTPDPTPSSALDDGGARIETGNDDGESKENTDNPFPEAEIDDMRAAKTVALQRFMQEMERRRDMAAKMNRSNKESSREGKDNMA
eukprot:gene3360-3683_t